MTEVEVIEVNFKDSQLAELLRRRLPRYPKMPEKLVVTKSKKDLWRLAGRQCAAATDGNVIIISPDSGVENVIHEIIHLNHPEWSEYKVETEEERAFMRFRRQETLDRIRERGILLGALDIFNERFIRETIAKFLRHRNARIRRYRSGYFSKERGN